MQNPYILISNPSKNHMQNPHNLYSPLATPLKTTCRSPSFIVVDWQPLFSNTSMQKPFVYYSSLATSLKPACRNPTTIGNLSKTSMIVETLQPLVTPLKPRVVNVRVVKVVFVCCFLLKGFYRFCEGFHGFKGCPWLFVSWRNFTGFSSKRDCQKLKLLQ